MLIVFDLDGTLIDSAKDLAISMNATRTHLHLPPLDPQLIYSFVGNGAATLVRRALGSGANDEMNAQGLAYFLQYYRAHALEHTRLYPDVQSMLDGLREQQIPMAVLTNKPAKISRDIVAALGLAHYFFKIYGGDSFSTKKPDPEGLNALIAESGATVDTVWMVGDSSVDIETARRAGVRSCGVSWGFQPEACRAAGPDAMVDEPDQLFKLFSAAAISVRESS